MDEFPGLLARDFGFRPQGKNAPMSATRSSSTGSGRSRSGWNPSDAALGGGGGISGDRIPPSYDDVFNLSSQARAAPAPSSSSPYPDSIFDGFKDPAPKSSSMPVYDKPVYDDDIFEGVPGVKKPSSGGGIDDVFSTISSTAGNDFLDNLGKAMPQQKGSDRGSGEQVSGFEELIPGFGGSSSPRRREAHERKQHSAASSANAASSDPFVVLQTTHTSTYPSSGIFGEPLQHTSRSISSGGAKLDAFPKSGGVLDDLNISDNITSSAPPFTPELNDKLKDQPPPNADDEPLQKSSVESSEHIVHLSKSSDSSNTGYRSGQNIDTSFNAYGRNTISEQASRSFEYQETADDVWLTVSEIPLFTQPTSAPPPLRPPPPVAIKQARFGTTDQYSSVGYNARRKDTNPFSEFTKSEQHLKNSVKRPTESPLDKFESSVTSKSQIYGYEHAEVLNGEEEMEKNLAAAAMKEAMDKAEAKFKHARGVRERERDARSAKNREAQQESDERVIPDTHDLEDKEKQYRLDREKEQIEREEKEEQKRREREREKELEKVRERERARQAVERATREARERAAAEARLKAERAAVEKANAEARQRAAEKAAFQRAANEARERAAAEAREKAAQEARAADEAREKAAIAEAQRKNAAEAQEKAAAEMREKAAMERAAVDAQRRAQRIAVERATKEARERAAAEAQRRAAAAAAAAREKQQAAEEDLESFFNVGPRPNSAPKQRTPSENPFNPQPQSRGPSDVPRRTSSSSSSTIRKTQSSTNIVDDLASVFGAPSSSPGEFQEIEGETDERRRARLERHQRTLERAKKALAEKNERDMQAQNEQAERHRISETLDFEIRRWSAGKEGNLRALLSTLHYVLWPECGWNPVSLTDLITGASVKKAYRKATLCIHPDKVQQKGATLQQKYIAEKVFDLLKEAWNKLNSEELF